MSIRYSLTVLAALLLAHPVFANDMNSKNQSCEMIAKSCLDAGYTNNGGEGKQFWQDCMRPVLLNKKVSDVTMDAKIVKACRVAKINELKQALSDLKKAK